MTKKIYSLSLYFILFNPLFPGFFIQAQKDSILTEAGDTAMTRYFFRQHFEDSTKITNQDAIFNRPFIGLGRTQTAVGGYLEGNTNYFSEDGITEGFSMEFRRFNIFLYSSVSQRIKFLSELEFEHGTEEINIETALIDFEIDQAVNLRAGILLPQIGIFNSNHDSPNWEFVERPLSSTKIIPSTLSEVGFGIHGKVFPGNNIISYNAYLVNGLQSEIILNSEGRTFLPAGKNEEMFSEDNNGVPMFNARVAITNRQAGEIGISYYGGVYNNFQSEGLLLDKRRMLDVYALDFSGQINKIIIQGEYVIAQIDVPIELTDIYGSKQNGGFVELIYPVISRRILSYEEARINISARLESIDYNYGKFSITHHEIRDEIKAVAGGISFRPTPSTIFRVNYRHHWQFDALGNPPVKIAGFQVGFASYF